MRIGPSASVVVVLSEGRRTVAFEASTAGEARAVAARIPSTYRRQVLPDLSQATCCYWCGRMSPNTKAELVPGPALKITPHEIAPLSPSRRVSSLEVGPPPACSHDARGEQRGGGRHFALAARHFLRSQPIRRWNSTACRVPNCDRGGGRHPVRTPTARNRVAAMVAPDVHKRRERAGGRPCWTIARLRSILAVWPQTRTTVR